MALISSMDELRNYCTIHYKELKKIDGDCRKCIRYKKCREAFKETQIIGFLNMDKDSSRFPTGLFDFLQSRPWLMRSLPASIYVLFYGNKQKKYSLHNKSWGCIFQPNQILDNLDSIQKVYEILDDKKSKQTYLNVLAYRLTADKKYIKNAYTDEPQYFIQGFCGEKDQAIYLDGGAYTGDTFLEYCKYNSPPDKAYLFEPDEANLGRLYVNVKPFRDKTDIIVIKKGIYNIETELYFKSGNDTSSSFSEQLQDNTETVSVTTIDATVPDKTSFIKMDIEAFEPFALQGARRTILRSYPKLAICIYHKTEHMWEIPLMIKKMAPNYSHFKVRHHRKDYAETVLYVYK